MWEWVMIDREDEDGNGVDLEGWSKMLKLHFAESKLTTYEERMSFELADNDCDGSLSKDEFVHGCIVLGRYLGDKETQTCRDFWRRARAVSLLAEAAHRFSPSLRASHRMPYFNRNHRNGNTIQNERSVATDKSEVCERLLPDSPRQGTRNDSSSVQPLSSSGRLSSFATKAKARVRQLCAFGGGSGGKEPPRSVKSHSHEALDPEPRSHEAVDPEPRPKDPCVQSEPNTVAVYLAIFVFISLLVVLVLNNLIIWVASIAGFYYNEAEPCVALANRSIWVLAQAVLDSVVLLMTLMSSVCAHDSDNWPYILGNVCLLLWHLAWVVGFSWLWVLFSDSSAMTAHLAVSCDTNTPVFFYATLAYLYTWLFALSLVIVTTFPYQIISMTISLCSGRWVDGTRFTDADAATSPQSCCWRYMQKAFGWLLVMFVTVLVVITIYNDWYLVLDIYEILNQEWELWLGSSAHFGWLGQMYYSAFDDSGLRAAHRGTVDDGMHSHW